MNSPISENYFQQLFQQLVDMHTQHAPSSKAYQSKKIEVRKYVENLFKKEDEVRNLGPLGNIHFPYVKMGAVDTLNLFDIDELIIFSYYIQNKNRYKKYRTCTN